MNAIFKRRSVRKYTDRPISEGDIKTLLKAAMRAPSAGNRQPWEFVVVKNKETLARVPEFHAYAKMLPHADTAIVVCGNLEIQGGSDDYWVQDCSAATQNILLAAVEMGIGAVWLGVHPMEERVKPLKELLNLPEHVIPLGIVSLGYPAEEPSPIDTFLPSRVHNEQWSRTTHKSS